MLPNVFSYPYFIIPLVNTVLFIYISFLMYSYNALTSVVISAPSIFFSSYRPLVSVLSFPTKL